MILVVLLIVSQKSYATIGAPNCPVMNRCEKTLPENDSIKQRHKKHECTACQVHDETNRAPNWAFYVQPADANTSIKIVQIVPEISKFDNYFSDAIT